MFDWMFNIVVCPECKCPLKPLKLIRRKGKTLGGVLLCDQCQEAYKIVSGIPVLLPPGQKYTPWCFPMQEIVSDPESFVTRRPKDRPPMLEVLTYFGKERVLQAIQHQRKLPPKKKKKLPDFDGPISPRERRRAYRVAQESSISRMIRVMKKKWDKNPLFTELVNSIVEHNPNNILDFGTGPGGLLYTLLSKLNDSRIIGLEYSFSNARMTQAGIEYSKGTSRGGMVEADARSMPFPTGFFDSVTSLYGSYHIPKYPVAIKEVYRVLKTGGRYFEIFYSKYPGFTKGLMAEEEERLLLKHLQLPTDRNDIESVCMDAGFRNVQEVTIGDSFLVKAQKPNCSRSAQVSKQREFG